jgi:hypothetical protein
MKECCAGAGIERLDETKRQPGVPASGGLSIRGGNGGASSHRFVTFLGATKGRSGSLLVSGETASRFFRTMKLIKNLSWLLALIGGAVALHAGETYEPFRSDLMAGAAYSIDARRLHPTQFSLGLREVAAKTAVIDAKDAAALAVYLKKKDVPLVIGPGGTPYLTDGHHTLRALIESRQADKTAYGHVLANWSGLAEDAFWARMVENHYAYLKDSDGQAAAGALPETLLKMQHDRWRGLAWGVMVAGGFEEKKGWFFQEFAWADFFRTRVSWNDGDDADFKRAVGVAVTLARSPEAAGLPGWTAAEEAR